MNLGRLLFQPDFLEKIHYIPQFKIQLRQHLILRVASANGDHGANQFKFRVHLIVVVKTEPAFIPVRSCSIDIHPNARWKQNGLAVAGGNGKGNGINQLSHPCGLYVDDDQTVYVVDQSNHRIMEWKSGVTSGQVVAGGSGQGSGTHQLSQPFDVIVDKETDTLIICDRSNRRVVRWPRRNGTNGETIISNIDCLGLTMDENGSLYVVDVAKVEVRRYRRGEFQGTVVAGGNRRGDRLDQLSGPTYICRSKAFSVRI
ncbi:unnamed protein product [Rotaria magnacalcarata]|uniref:Uncharacterized protein n=1 Tax=Rotaria magnacalcarata TaxID=392030 RepID=A0A816N1L1_9BILA|nr:unnamed protein product [Rotaria magnacalcarata]